MSVIQRSDDLPAASGNSSSSRTSYGVLWALGAVFFWSQSAAVIKISVHSLPWLTVAVWTSIFAALSFLVVMLVTGRLAALRRTPVRQLLLQAGIGTLGGFFYICCIFSAYRCGPATEVLIVNSLWPVATVAFAALISRELPRRRDIGGLGLAMLGAIFVATRGHFLLPQAFAADLLAFCGALCYGLYSAASKRVQCDQIVYLFIGYTSSAMLFLLVALLTRSTLRIEHTNAWLLTGYYGVGVGAIPTLCWLMALKAQNTSRAAIFS